MYILLLFFILVFIFFLVSSSLFKLLVLNKPVIAIQLSAYSLRLGNNLGKKYLSFGMHNFNAPLHSTYHTIPHKYNVIMQTGKLKKWS